MGRKGKRVKVGMPVGDWPHPEWNKWLQWTASPPHVADLDQDGRNKVIGIPNVEFDVPDSGCDCLLWTTARGGPLRMGQPGGMD